MENSLSLSDCHVKKTNLIINRLHFFLHGTALLSLFYYRITSLITTIFQTTNAPLLPHVLIFIAELLLSFIWVLGQPSKWRPVTRTVYPERLPRDEKLPSVDVFVCTADPSKEPVLQVMNTVISALALDYPPDKLHVYLSDDGGSHVTSLAVKYAWKFSELWIPFCRKYRVKNGCPEAYFSGEEESEFVGELFDSSHEFLVEKKDIEKRYEEFKNSVAKIVGGTSAYMSRDHPSVVEVINDSNNGDRMLPLLVYVAREKRPSHPHNFKAGAINVLLRISAMISNAPYILVLDCDMYCNDPSSARQAMCFHLDSKSSEKLAFVQFPQTFHNISDTDIYDCQLRFVWPKYEGFDGLRGPILSGTCFYIKREALYGTRKFKEDVDLLQLKKCFGSSNEFVKSIYRNYKPNYLNYTKISDNALHKELHLLASCSYDNDTKWGKEASGVQILCSGGRLFYRVQLALRGMDFSVLRTNETVFLGRVADKSGGDSGAAHALECGVEPDCSVEVFSSVVRPTENVDLSKHVLFGIGLQPNLLLQFFALYILAVVPQLCLIQGVPLYPEVSSPYFLVFLFVFLSSQLKHVQEIFSMGHTVNAWSNEQRIWMMRSLTSYLYATLDAVMEKIGLKNNSFLPTNKVVDEDQAKRYRTGVYDFQAPTMFMVPLCTLYILNIASFGIGIWRIFGSGKRNEMVVQVLIPLFAAVLHFPLLEGMVLRKDKGRVSSFVSRVSVVISAVILFSAFLF